MFLKQSTGIQSGRFSFNLPGGRCERCKGDGMVKLDMQFLADVLLSAKVARGGVIIGKL